MEAEKAKGLTEIVQRLSTERPDLASFTHLVADWFKQWPFIGILILLMILDTLTGWIAAGVHKDIDSNVSYKGALRKGQMLLMVAAGMVFELLYPDVPWGRLIAGLLCLGEMASIIENADKAGVPIPQALRETMRRLRSAEKEANKKDNSIEATAKVDIHVDTERVDPPKSDSPVGKPPNKHKDHGSDANKVSRKVDITISESSENPLGDKDKKQ